MRSTETEQIQFNSIIVSSRPIYSKLSKGEESASLLQEVHGYWPIYRSVYHFRSLGTT